MKHLVLIVVLASCCQAAAQGRFAITLTADPPTPADALMGSATLSLEGMNLSYELELTGRWLGNYGPSMDPRTLFMPLITLDGFDSTTPLPWFRATLGAPNYDIVIRLPEEPPLSADYYWARYTFSGSVALSETVVAGLLRGEGVLALDYGQWGAVSGAVVVVPEPSTLALCGTGLTLLLLRLRARAHRWRRSQQTGFSEPRDSVTGSVRTSVARGP